MGLVVSIASARLLGQVGYGQLGIIVSTVGALSAVGNIGLGLTATRYVAHLRCSDPVKAGRTAGSALTLATLSYGFCSLCLFLFAPFIARRFLNAPELVTELRLSSIMLMLGGVDGVQQGILAGFEAFKVMARVTLIRGILNLPVSCAAAWLFGLDGAVAAMVIIACVSAWINNRAIKGVCKQFNLSLVYTLDRSQISLLWSFSLPSFLVGMLGMPSVWIVNAMIVNQPDGFRELALLTAASQWMAVANLVPSVLSQTGVSIQSNLLGEGNRTTYRKLVSYNLLLQVGGMAVMAFLIALLSPWIMRSYGQGFSNGVLVLILMTIGWVFMSVGSVFWDAMASTGEIWWGFAIKLASMLVFISISWGTVAKGAQGVAIAYIVSYAVFAVLQALHYFITEKKTDVGLQVDAVDSSCH